MAIEGGGDEEEKKDEKGVFFTEEGQIKGLAYADEVLEENGNTDQELSDDDGGELLHVS